MKVSRVGGELGVRRPPNRPPRAAEAPILASAAEVQIVVFSRRRSASALLASLLGLHFRP